ncbi:MAG: ATP-binding protein, partial [Pseudomonadota bacterium]
RNHEVLIPLPTRAAAPLNLGLSSSSPVTFDPTSPPLTALDNTVIRPLVTRAARGTPARVWVPDCGDGTAAFGIAMMFEAAGERAGTTAMPRIFATDRDPDHVQAASKGRLGRDVARPLLRAGHRRRLRWTGDAWQVKPDLRGRVLFSVQDTLYDTPFGNIDLILAPASIRRSPSGCNGCLMDRLVNALAPDGVLYLGASTAWAGDISNLTAVDQSNGLYRRSARPRAQRCGETNSAPHGALLLERVAHHFAPAALVVDVHGTIRATMGEPELLLAEGANNAPFALGTGTAPSLRGALVSAFVEAVRTDAPAWRVVDRDSEAVVRAEAMTCSPLDPEPLWLVRLSRGRLDDVRGGDAEPNLRAHLVTAARGLKSAIEEVQSRNRALATANDELHAINQELETTNHRLARVNTELGAIRQDHERKIGELTAVSQDVENLLRSADIAIVVVDGERRIRRYTPAAAQLFCLTKRTAGTSLTEALANDRTADLDDVVAAVIRNGESVRTQMTLERGRDGHRSLFVQVRPYIRGRSTVGGAILSFVDVTEIKAAQDALERKNVALERANEDLERFAYIASHDLKSPLRSVRTMLEFLRTDLGEALSRDNATNLDLVAERVSQMERMIGDLLTYSRLGRQAGAVAGVDTRALVDGQIELAAPPPGFTVTIDGELPTIATDASLLEHVVRNLVENAIKHHDLDEGSVVIRATDVDGVTMFEVADDGPGIPTRFQQRVFEIFQKGGGRADKSGSGMGLALVKKAVERVGGTIELCSDDDQRGCTFRFTWPESLQPDVSADQ